VVPLSPPAEDRVEGQVREVVLDERSGLAGLDEQAGVRGIEPEVFDYRLRRVISPGYQLRPEIIESAYYLSHYTKNPRYLAMGRRFFDDLVTHCRTEDGYATLKSVLTHEKKDLMPSYFLAETLKYLYLLFAPETIDFEGVVFNTEAHPLRRIR